MSGFVQYLKRLLKFVSSLWHRIYLKIAAIAAVHDERGEGGAGGMCHHTCMLHEGGKYSCKE